MLRIKLGWSQVKYWLLESNVNLQCNFHFCIFFGSACPGLVVKARSIIVVTLWYAINGWFGNIQYFWYIFERMTFIFQGYNFFSLVWSSSAHRFKVYYQQLVCKGISFNLDFWDFRNPFRVTPIPLKVSASDYFFTLKGAKTYSHYCNVPIICPLNRLRFSDRLTDVCFG